MTTLIEALWGWPIVKRIRSPNNDDEHVDRLNHRVTVGLILFAVSISITSPITMNRISCWLPTELKKEYYLKYIENYCWISNTYYVHSNVTPPQTDEERRNAQIGYYQWVPILLLLMALGFYLPRLFWRSFNIHSGIDIQSLIEKSQIVSRDSTTKVTTMLEYYCEHYQEESSTKSPVNFQIFYHRHKHSGNYLLTIYFLTRLMYLFNSILQMILLHVLLGHRGHTWYLNFDIVRSILRYGNPLLDSPYFPRVTLCDVPVREIAEIHRYTVQCALPINMLNEKIFLALSFWFSYLVVHNLISFLLFLYQQLPQQRSNYIRYLSRLIRRNDRGRDVEQYLRNRLTFDGIFLLRLISHNSSELQSMEMIRTMLDNAR